MNERHQLLDNYPKPVSQLADRLCNLVMHTIPDLHEQVYTGWKLIGFKLPARKRAKYFCFVYPLITHVSLGFEYGVFMSDPDKILAGNGSQVRSIKVENLSAIDETVFAKYIREAANAALLSNEERLRIQLEKEISNK